MKFQGYSIAKAMPRLAAGLLFAAAAVAEEPTASLQTALSSTTIAGYVDTGLVWAALGTNTIRTIPSRNLRSANGQWDSRFRLPPGVNGEVNCVAVWRGDLYVGGRFTRAGGYPARGLARWDGTAWRPVAGIDGAVNALTPYGNSLYVGGSFRLLGAEAGTNVARLTRHGWRSLGGGIPVTGQSQNFQYVTAIAVRGKDVFVGGSFDMAGGIEAANIAQWNGRRWSSLGQGVGRNIHPDSSVTFGQVEALAVIGTDLYVGGLFDRVGGVWATNVACWDGKRWSALGEGLRGGNTGYRVTSETPHSGVASALAVQGRDLIAGGDFARAGEVSATNLARWNGRRWSSVGGGVQSAGVGGVGAILVRGAEIHVAGRFERAGRIAVNNIARWDGRRWQALDGGVPGFASALAWKGRSLYLGGFFGLAGGEPAAFIAQRNRGAWAALGSPNNGMGYLLPGPGYPALVTPATNALIGWVEAIAAESNHVYVGGTLFSAGRVPVNHVAQWNGTNWSDLGGGIPGGHITSLAVGGGNVYVGGHFVLPSVGATNLARWDGAAWSAVGGGVTRADALGRRFPGIVNYLAVSGSKLYVSGSFNFAGETSATNLASWDGLNWSAPSPEFATQRPDSTGPEEPDLGALAADETSVYVSGRFDGAGDLAVTNLARWDGNSWSALGDGLVRSGSAYSSIPRCLALQGSNLFVSGSFEITAAGTVATNLLRWDGTSWSAPGLPIQGVGFILSMAATERALYVGGHLTNVAGFASQHLVQWDGTNWMATGGGGVGSTSPDGLSQSERVHVLAAASGRVYVGGQFSEAGGHSMFNFAVWNESIAAVSYPWPPPLPTRIGVPQPPAPMVPVGRAEPRVNR